MTVLPAGAVPTQIRAAQSGGVSADAIYTMVARGIEPYGPTGTAIDLGFGMGNLHDHVGRHFDRYIGIDVVDYRKSQTAEFLAVDLESESVPLDRGIADFVFSVETIEHLENPRAFFREAVRLTRPGGVVVITTPNQLSLLNILCVAAKGRHVQFQESDYPRHLSALLEVDLIRMSQEAGFEEFDIFYTGSGRIPFTSRHYPQFVSAMKPRLFSDNVMLIGRKPLDADESL